MRGRWADNAYHFPTADEPERPAPVDQYDLQASTNANTRYVEFCNEIADIIVDRRAAWRQHAACRGIGPELFFPVVGDHATPASAREVCDQCDVRRECADYGIDQRWGIWGGRAVRSHHRNVKGWRDAGASTNR